MPANRGRSLRCAAIAQLVERLICNQQVGSSILSGGCPTRFDVRPEWGGLTKSSSGARLGTPIEGTGSRMPKLVPS